MSNELIKKLATNYCESIERNANGKHYLFKIDMLEAFAKAVIEATREQEGWQLVPIEPTDEMSSYENTGVHWQICERIYKAMLARAPTKGK